ncbi:MAG TPA: hypothetical protein VM076_22775 [Gemmatimonadaceae bacterium]|nr:hypothetical protein [Gemmatimonadaceae bacterium]
MDEMDRRNVGEDPTIIGNDAPRSASSDDRDVTAKPVRGDNPTTADYVGEATGGVSGGLAGAAIGSIGGPVGTLIGGLAGVIGGWWAGRSIAEAAKDYGDADDSHYRTHYEGSSRLADRSYDDVRPAYQLGHIASRNPDYQGRDFDTVESDLRRGWSDDVGARHGDWSSVRDYAREGYSRGSSSMSGSGDRSSHAADRVSTGLEGGVDNDRLSDTGSSSGSGFGDAARRGANRVVDAVDDVKDRIDGNPASKPGPDPTDRRL